MSLVFDIELPNLVVQLTNAGSAGKRPLKRSVRFMFSADAALQATCRLIAMFISNVNVSGYSVTANVHGTVGTQLLLTSQHVLAVLRRYVKSVNSHAVFILLMVEQV